jgi:hypothetical protein
MPALAGIPEAGPTFQGLGRHSSQPVGVTSCWAGISPSGISAPRSPLGPGRESSQSAPLLAPIKHRAPRRPALPRSPQRHAPRQTTSPALALPGALVSACLIDPRRDRSSPLLNFHQGRYLGSFTEKICIVQDIDKTTWL